MRKIINFGVRPDEIPEFKRVAEKYQLECLLTKNPLSAANQHLLDGCDGFTDTMARTYDRQVYEHIQQQQITAASFRSAGVDGFDGGLAEEYGVKFARVPDYSPNAIAEFSVALALSLTRKLPLLFNKLTHQDFRLDNLLGKEIQDLRIGIMGTGHIGKIAANIFHGFGSKITAYDINPDPELENILLYQPDLDYFLSQTDLLMIYLPLNSATENIINQRTLQLLPAGSYLVNVGRGGLVKSDDLAAALESGHLAGAALDVHQDEREYVAHDFSGKIISSPQVRRLQSLPNVILTPHMAFYTDNAVANMVEMAVKNLIDILETGQSANLIKPQS